MHQWQMQAAKARFSELIQQSTQDGPQDIVLDGRSVAVVISRELFDRLSGNDETLVAFMRSSPLYGRDEIDFKRDPSGGVSTTPPPPAPRP